MDPVLVAFIGMILGSGGLGALAVKWLNRTSEKATSQDTLIGRLQGIVDNYDEREKFWTARDKERDRREDVLLQHIYMLNAWILDRREPPPPPIPPAAFQ